MTAPASSPAERDSVRKLFTRLHQAYRGFRLYPADHPSARHALEEFVLALSAHLDRWGPLGLVVEEDQILFQDQTVYYQEDNRTNLAFMMFRDGIRFLAFQPGLMQEEAEAFVDCLSQSDDLAGIEYDLTTALWERDLQHIEYEVVDPFLGAGGEALRNDVVTELRETVVRRLGELTPSTTTASPPNHLAGLGGAGGGVIVGVGDGEGGQAGTDGEAGGQASDNEEDSGAGEGVLDASGITLTQEEIEQGEQAVADLATTTLSDFAVVLLEIAGNPADPPGGQEVLARSLSLAAQQYLDGGDIDGFAFMVGRLQDLEEQGRRSPGFGRSAIGEAMTAERLVRVVERGSQASAEEAARIEELLTKIREWIFPGLLEALAESSDKAVRKTVLALLDIEGGVPAQYLWPLMDDSRWFVVRNAVQLATRTGDPELGRHLERLLYHHDARVRREVMRSLDTLPDAQAATLLSRALSDDDSSVRTLAAHGLARHGNRGQVAVLQAQVESRDLDTRQPEEVSALLWAYASLGGDATVSVLGRMWKRRLFGTRAMPVRVAAVQALAAVDSPAAREALQTAAKSGEAQLQRAAARALSTGRTGITGPGS
jgi:hypothetical protein